MRWRCNAHGCCGHLQTCWANPAKLHDVRIRVLRNTWYCFAGKSVTQVRTYEFSHAQLMAILPFKKPWAEDMHSLLEADNDMAYLHVKGTLETNRVRPPKADWMAPRYPDYADVLETYKVGSATLKGIETMCSICWSSWEDTTCNDDTTMELPCAGPHKFHRKCIIQVTRLKVLKGALNTFDVPTAG